MDALLQKIKRTRILVVGDAMLDCYAFGQFVKTSAEAPIPVFREMETKRMLGGAANVALNLQRAGQATVTPS